MARPVLHERRLPNARTAGHPYFDIPGHPGAEREGFEPSDPVTQVNSLAVSPIRPLSHLSVQVRGYLCPDLNRCVSILSQSRYNGTANVRGRQAPWQGK